MGNPKCLPVHGRAAVPTLFGVCGVVHAKHDIWKVLRVIPLHHPCCARGAAELHALLFRVSDKSFKPLGKKCFVAAMAAVVSEVCSLRSCRHVLVRACRDVIEKRRSLNITDLIETNRLHCWVAKRLHSLSDTRPLAAFEKSSSN